MQYACNHRKNLPQERHVSLLSLAKTEQVHPIMSLFYINKDEQSSCSAKTPYKNKLYFTFITEKVANTLQ